MSTMTLAEMVDAAVARRLAELAVAQPARVERFDAAKHLVDVLPLLKSWRRVDEETEESITLPIITNVPVCFPGAGAAGITWDIPVGSTVLLIHADRSLDLWLAQGGVVDPGFRRTHALTDAVAIATLRPFSAPLPNAATDAITLHGPVKLGAHDATDFVAMASKVNTALAALAEAINTHTHTVAAGVAAVTTNGAGALVGVGSTIVKVG